VFCFAPSGEGDKASELRGSGRSIPGFHLRDCLDLVAKRAPGLLARFGGHAQAAGLTLRAADFERFRGHRAKIRTLNPINGQKNFSGVLEGLAAGSVTLNTGQTTVAIAIDAISKAYLTDA